MIVQVSVVVYPVSLRGRVVTSPISFTTPVTRCDVMSLSTTQDVYASRSMLVPFWSITCSSAQLNFLSPLCPVISAQRWPNTPSGGDELDLNGPWLLNTQIPPDHSSFCSGSFSFSFASHYTSSIYHRHSHHGYRQAKVKQTSLPHRIFLRLR